MKVATKLTLALVLGILAVMAAYAWVQVRQEVVLFESDVRHAARGVAFRAAIQAVWREEGETRARTLVDEVAEGLAGVHVRWIPMDRLRTDAGTALSDEDMKTLAAGDIREVVRLDDAGVWWRYHYLPMGADVDNLVIEAFVSLHNQSTYVQMSHRAMLLATTVVTLVCGLIAMGLGFRFVGRPIRLLRDQARRMGNGDFSTPLTVHQRDEIGELAEEMNALCRRLVDANNRVAVETEARIEALEQLRHSDRLATVGQMASGIAHELGTPLSIVSARAALVTATDTSPGEVAKNARIIVEQASRMTDIIRQLLDFSRRRGTRMGIADLRRLVERMIELLSSGARRNQVTLQLTPGPGPLLARVDQNQIQQALTNVLVNAIQAMPRGGRVTVGLGPEHATPPPDRESAADDYLCVTIEDEGTGIAPEHVPHVFEPFFTTKGVGEGTGLGLSVAHGIVAEHGGWIQVDSELGKGTRFRIFLPPAARELREEAS